MNSLRCFKFLRLLLPLFVVATACVEPYSPPEISGTPDYLVIDAFLNATENSCQATLSRAVSLTSEESSAPIEDNPADPIVVFLEDEQGTQFQLFKTAPGKFEAHELSLDVSRKYRLTVKITSTEKYESDFVEVKQTPEIDEVFYEIMPEEVKIMVSTANGAGKGSYYRWRWDETWEYVSPYYSMYKLENDSAIFRTEAEQIYRCYKSDPSDNIYIASSTELNSDVIKNFEIRTIPRESQKLVLRYSINVKQMALTEDAYTYWFNLYKTTENVGGLFDPMPGEVSGNFRKVSNPSETVIGYFSASTVQEQRIFISDTDLPSDYVAFQYSNCQLDTVLIEDLHQVGAGNLLVSPIYSQGFPVIIGFTNSNQTCVDCRKVNRGGTLEKPPFWP
jgi:hypothetical protein